MTVNTSGTPLSWDDYYPFGSIMSGRSANNSGIDGRYKFTGKERDIAINGAETGNDYFGARYEFIPLTAAISGLADGCR